MSNTTLRKNQKN